MYYPVLARALPSISRWRPSKIYPQKHALRYSSTSAALTCRASLSHRQVATDLHLFSCASKRAQIHQDGMVARLVASSQAQHVLAIYFLEPSLGRTTQLTRARINHTGNLQGLPPSRPGNPVSPQRAARARRGGAEGGDPEGPPPSPVHPRHATHLSQPRPGARLRAPLQLRRLLHARGAQARPVVPLAQRGRGQALSAAALGRRRGR